MQMKTFKMRLYPSKAQTDRLYQTLNVCRHWYNMCLEDRKLAWELERRSISRYDQQKTAVYYRCAFPKAKIVSSGTMQNVCGDVDKAFKAFFRRVKVGEKPGYPRFKGKEHFDSFGFNTYGNGNKIDGRRLYLFGIGRIRVRWDRPLEGKIKTIRVCCQAGKWFVSFFCELPDPIALPETGKQTGIDLNVENLLTDSEGQRIESPKYYRQAQRDLRIAQRGLQRKQRGGKNRRKALLRVQRLQEHVKNQRQDLLNKVVHTYIQANDLIALEDLHITNMVRNHHLSKSILDQGWGYLRERFIAKAVEAGRQIVLVDPAYTSKTCSGCGKIFQDFSLSIRWIDCECGLSLARDHNAAINILKRATNGRDTSARHNVGARDQACLESPCT